MLVLLGAVFGPTFKRKSNSFWRSRLTSCWRVATQLPRAVLSPFQGGSCVLRFKGHALHFGGHDWPVSQELQSNCLLPSWALSRRIYILLYILYFRFYSLFYLYSGVLYSTLPYSPQYSSLDSTPYSTLLYSAPLLYSTLLSPLESRLLSYFSTSGLQDQPTGLKTSWQLHMFNFRNSEFLYKYSFHKNWSCLTWFKL